MNPITNPSFLSTNTSSKVPLPRQKRKQIWLVSLLDLITLVLCFFVMLYSMSSPNWKNKSTAMPSELNGYIAQIVPPRRAVNLNYLNQILCEYVASDFNGDNIRILLSDEVLNRLDLSLLATPLNSITNQIFIEVESSLAHSETSLLKGLELANAFKQNGLSSPLTVVIKPAPTDGDIYLVISDKQGGAK